jgi:hypothetical protein
VYWSIDESLPVATKDEAAMPSNTAKDGATPLRQQDHEATASTRLGTSSRIAGATRRSTALNAEAGLAAPTLTPTLIATSAHPRLATRAALAAFVRLANASETRGDRVARVSACEFRPQVQARAVDEHTVVGDERDAPAHCRGGDPQVSVVLPLVQGVADHAALVIAARAASGCPGVKP